MNKATESLTPRIKSAPARWQRLKQVLADALEKTSLEERMILIRRLCADDTTLLCEAEKLLALDTTTFEDFAELAAKRLRKDEYYRVGERMGAYAVIKELGRGGMGAVYLAERADGQFEKRVAIKVLKRGTDTDEMLRCFRTERQILANLEHSNITRLLDAGTTIDGLPYFVMEFIEGTPITQFVRQEKVNLRDRLKLFLHVCSAVILAHQKQIIHRDIKPSNVLVNRDGEPKLLDFGIARLLSAATKDASTTATANRRLTPMYAAPEQREGRPATIAADVYSLGVLLCELVTNETPSIDGGGKAWGSVKPKCLKKGQLAAHVTPDAKAEHQLRCQLDRIVSRATHRDPTRRYCSVADLSEDIKQYLNRATLPSAAKSRSGNLNMGAYSGLRWRITAGRVAAIVIAAIIVLGAPRLYWLSKERIANTSSLPTPGSLTDTVRSIAVLPFEPLGQDINNELLGLGMADAVIGRMSNVKNLVVLPTSAVSKYKGRANAALIAGRALGVDAILNGTVQRSADQVRVTVQLVHVASGRTIWSEKYDQTFTNIFGIQDSISDSVVRSLVLHRTTDERKRLEKRYTTNTPAYDSYLMGLYFWNQRSKDGLEKAIDYFGRAVEEDPHFALAYALMADCYYLQYYYRYDSRPDCIQNAKIAIQRALLLDDSIAEAHVAEAMVQLHDGENDGAMASLRRALALNPNLPVAHMRYAWELCSLGHLNDAIREMRRSQELDPLSPVNNTDLGIILVFARQYRAALEYCYKAAELAPSDVPILENLAFAYAANGMYEKAIENYRKATELEPNEKGDGLASIASVLALAGRKSEADSIMPEVLQLGSSGKADPFNIAVLYGTRGDKDAAFHWLSKALQQGSEVRTNAHEQAVMRYNPFLDPLRSDSRFAELLRQHNLGSLLEAPAGS